MMAPDILTVAWKEWLEFRDQLLRLKRGGLSALIVLLMLGIITPLQMGPLWLTSPLMLAYWPLLSSGMVSTLIADAFAGERERHTLETLLASRLSDTSILLGKVLAAIVYGIVFTSANIVVGVITLTITHVGEGIQAPSPTHVGYMLVLVTLACSTLAGIGVFISLRAATVRQAQQTLGIIMMVMFIGPVLFIQFLDSEARMSLAARLTTLGTGRLVGWASALLLAASVILIVMAMTRFKRGKLTLD
ncbi:MAG TPA: ABC transporter permease subunit [Gemmatimonadaceae bacterium]